MVKGDVIVLRCKVNCPLLYRLFQNGAHPLDLQFGVEGGGDILEHKPQRVVQPGGGKEEPEEIEERKFSGRQKSSAGQDGGCQTQPEKRLGGADEHAGCQLRVDGAFLHGCKFPFQFFHVRVLPAACLDIPDGFQSFLDTVGDRPFI